MQTLLKTDRTDAQQTLLRAENPCGNIRLIHAVVWEIICCSCVHVLQYPLHHAYVNAQETVTGNKSKAAELNLLPVLLLCFTSRLSSWFPLSHSPLKASHLLRLFNVALLLLS